MLIVAYLLYSDGGERKMSTQCTQLFCTMYVSEKAFSSSSSLTKSYVTVASCVGNFAK